MENFKEISEQTVFWHYAREHLPEMRLLFRGGRLSKKEGDWNNVIDHCSIQGAEVDALSSLLGLPEEEKERWQKAAFVHDWNKRLEKEGNFTDIQKQRAFDLLREVSPDLGVLEATSLGFSRKILDGQASFLQRLMFYIDNITQESQIVGYETRLSNVEAKTNFNEDSELTQRLGGRFGDIERQACRQVEEELFFLLKGKGIKINLPQDIPQLIRNEVIRKITK